jgi:hypothetical protein
MEAPFLGDFWRTLEGKEEEDGRELKHLGTKICKWEV